MSSDSATFLYDNNKSRQTLPSKGSDHTIHLWIALIYIIYLHKSNSDMGSATVVSCSSINQHCHKSFWYHAWKVSFFLVLPGEFTGYIGCLLRQDERRNNLTAMLRSLESCIRSLLNTFRYIQTGNQSNFHNFDNPCDSYCAFKFKPIAVISFSSKIVFNSLYLMCGIYGFAEKWYKFNEMSFSKKKPFGDFRTELGKALSLRYKYRNQQRTEPNYQME